MAGQESHAHSSDQTSDYRRCNKGNGQALNGAHQFETQLVLGAGSLANDAQLTEHDGEWTVQGDPTEAAFLVAVHKLEGTTTRMGRFERRAEIPFTSERKMMSTLHQERNDGTRLLFSKGGKTGPCYGVVDG